MAIEITTFNYPTTPADNIDEVYDWLTENVAGFFPGGIAKDGYNRILCYPIEGDTNTVLAIPFQNTNQASVGFYRAKYATTNQVFCPNGSASTTNAYRKAAVTSCGFVLMADATGATVFVTRTTSGSVCVYTVGSTVYNNVQMYGYFTDLENSNGYASIGTAANVGTLISNNRFISEGQTTSLLPIVFPGGSHTTNMFMTQFTQAGFSANFERVLLDGQEYVYDGFIALKG